MFVIVISHFTILMLYCINVIMFWFNLLCKVKLLLLLFHIFRLYGITLNTLFVFQSVFNSSYRWLALSKVNGSNVYVTVNNFVLNSSNIHFRMPLSGKKALRRFKEAHFDVACKFAKLLLFLKYFFLLVMVYTRRLN